MKIWVVECSLHGGPWYPSVASIFYLKKSDALEEVRGRNELKKKQRFNQLRLRVIKYTGEKNEN